MFMLFLYMLCPLCVFNDVEGKFLEFSPKSEEGKEFWAENKIKKGWKSPFLEEEILNIDLPSIDGDKHVFFTSIDAVYTEDKLNPLDLQLRLTKESPLVLSRDVFAAWLLSTYIGIKEKGTDGIYETIEEIEPVIGRIIQMKAGPIPNLTIKILADGTFSIVNNQDFSLNEFDLGNGFSNYTAISTNPDLPQDQIHKALAALPMRRVKDIKLAHKYPAIVSCITTFGGLGSFGFTSDCSVESMNQIKQSNNCYNPQCTFYGFSSQGVKNAHDFEMRDHSNSVVTCQLNVPKMSYNDPKLNQQNAFGGSVATTMPDGALYKVAAANCDKETQNRACFNGIPVSRADLPPRLIEYWKKTPEGSFANCQDNGEEAEVTCCTSATNCDADHQIKLKAEDATRDTQNQVCSLYSAIYLGADGKRRRDKIRFPGYASCIKTKTLKIATPKACSLQQNKEVTCKLKQYSGLPTFTVPASSCSAQDMQDACSIGAEPVSCR